MSNLLEYQMVNFSYPNKAVLKDICLSVRRGKILVIVGQSGSGKSTLLKLTMGLINQKSVNASGKIIFQDKNLLALEKKEWSKIRGEQIGMIFQNASQYFDDYQTIGKQYQRMLESHHITNKANINKHMCQSLRKAALPNPENVLKQYSFELSGGMAQRVAIAMALDLRPQLLLADEPTSALDVTSQKQILDELLTLKNDTSMTMIVVTHNMAVGSYLADDIAVMKDGRIVEIGTRDQILNHPTNDYTRQLLQAAGQWGIKQHV